MISWKDHEPHSKRRPSLGTNKCGHVTTKGQSCNYKQIKCIYDMSV